MESVVTVMLSMSGMVVVVALAVVVVALAVVVVAFAVVDVVVDFAVVDVVEELVVDDDVVASVVEVVETTEEVVDVDGVSPDDDELWNKRYPKPMPMRTQRSPTVMSGATIELFSR